MLLRGSGAGFGTARRLRLLCPSPLQASIFMTLCFTMRSFTDSHGRFSVRGHAERRPGVLGQLCGRHGWGCGRGWVGGAEGRASKGILEIRVRLVKVLPGEAVLQQVFEVEAGGGLNGRMPG